MPRTTHFRSVLFVSISALALSACSGSSGTNQAKSSAPRPPITEMDAAMNAPAPQPLSESDTLTPVMPRATGESVEERIARLEQSVNAIQGDYQKIMPAFASLNTTNERIQKLLNQIEKETGKKVVLADAATPVAPAAPVTTITTTKTAATPVTPATTVTSVETKETVPATGVAPAAGTVSRASAAAPVKTVTDTTTTVTTDAVVHSDAATTSGAPPLSAFKEQPTVEEARAEAARQTGKSAATTESRMAAAAPASGGSNAVTGVRIGEHGTKTRLVFDLDGKSKPAFKYDLDNGEHLLLVEMPSSSWTGKSSGKPKSPLVEGWTASAGADGGSTVAIQLKKDARVLSTEFLKAEGKDPARLVVDIAPQG